MGYLIECSYSNLSTSTLTVVQGLVHLQFITGFKVWELDDLRSYVEE